jgi:uncharacterized caspase-like protein
MMNWPALRKWHRFLFAATLLLLCQPAWATKRVALVVGNSAYQNVALLPNPVNDGAMIATTLKNAGFDVVDSRHDVPAAELRHALRDFADRARDADIAVVYYAGHGMEVNGTNYLIPVDAKLERDTDVFDEAVSLDRVLVAIEPAKQLRLVILDACRDNPFVKSMKRTVASRAVGRGLAQVEPASPNTLIAYSAKAGSTALDGDSTNSPFTIALSKHLTTPGLDVRRAFGFVRDDVLKDTANRQEPFVYGSLGGDDVPLVPAPVAAPPAAAPSARSEARRDYELALQVGNKDALDAFVAQYPDGFYANLARIQLAKIAAEEARIAATEKARLAEQQRARLAAEGAQTAQQLQAAEAEAKAAEQARVAAEKAKQVALEQAAEAERKRATAETSAAVTAPPVVEKAHDSNVAALTPGPPPQVDLAKSVQTELRRVGCMTGAADGEWNAASQRSLMLFNRSAGTKFDVKAASLDALDAIKRKSSRVCPLVCDHGFRAEGDRCGKIVCGDGSFLNDDNECEKRRGKTSAVTRERNDRRERAGRAARYDRDIPERLAPEFGAPRPRASQRASGSGGGQIVCGISGCAPVTRGCHVEFKTTAQGGPVEGGGGNVQVCN